MTISKKTRQIFCIFTFLVGHFEFRPWGGRRSFLFYLMLFFLKSAKQMATFECYCILMQSKYFFSSSFYVYSLQPIPHTKTVTIGPRAFAVFSPTAWNNLPVDLRDPSLSLSNFRKKLKTHLFKSSSAC